MNRDNQTNLRQKYDRNKNLDEPRQEQRCNRSKNVYNIWDKTLSRASKAISKLEHNNISQKTGYRSHKRAPQTKLPKPSMNNLSKHNSELSWIGIERNHNNIKIDINGQVGRVVQDESQNATLQKADLPPAESSPFFQTQYPFYP